MIKKWIVQQHKYIMSRKSEISMKRHCYERVLFIQITACESSDHHINFYRHTLQCIHEILHNCWEASLTKLHNYFSHACDRNLTHITYLHYFCQYLTHSVSHTHWTWCIWEARPKVIILHGHRRVIFTYDFIPSNRCSLYSSLYPNLSRWHRTPVPGNSHRIFRWSELSLHHSHRQAVSPTEHHWNGKFKSIV